MTALDAPTLTRRDVLRASAALPALALAARLSPALAAQATPAATAPDLVAGNTAFALDLYAQLRQVAAGNLLFSPFSVSQALAMTYAGARGETAAQMDEVLSFGLEGDALGEAFHTLDADLVGRGTVAGTDGALRIAGGLWGEQAYPFSEAYSAELEQWYGAGLQRVDFLNASDAARQEINAWVADKTEDRIENIVPEGAITSMTRFVLANAIYFYGPWLDPFNTDRTANDTFHLLDGSEATVPFMLQQTHYGYAKGPGFVAVELAYEQDGFAMTVIVPDAGTFDAFEAAFDVAALETAFGQLSVTEIVLHLPKFEFDFASSMADALVALGMTDAFDLARADFSGMVEGTPPEPLAIGDVLHKAFISVDEEGTEAAAATVVIGVGAGAPAEAPPEVRVDRPFLFAIRDTVTGTVLFLGRVLDPSA